jgi:hypothetical protein
MTHIKRICCHIWLDIFAIRAHLAHRLYGLKSNGIGGSFLSAESANCEATYQLLPMSDCMDSTARFHGVVIN